MKKLILSIFCLLIVTFSFAQQKEIDSIETIIATIKTDSVRLKKMDSLIRKHYRYRNSVLHKYLVEKAITNAKAQKDRRLEGIWYSELGLNYRLKGAIDSSNVFTRKALKIGKEIDDFKLINTAKSSLATNYENVGNYIAAIELYNQTMEAYRVRGKKEHYRYLSTKYNLIGLYLATQDNDKAKKLALEMYEDEMVKNDTEFLSEICIQLSQIYSTIENYSESLKYLKEAETIEKRPYLKGIIYGQFGGIYSGLENYNKATTYFKKSLGIMKNMGDKNRIINVKFNLGSNYYNAKNYRLAEKEYDEVAQLLKKDDKLNPTLEKALYEAYVELYSDKGNYKKAFDFFTKQVSVQDSILGIEKQKAISDIKIKYETEKIKREKETAEQTAVINKLESDKQRNRFLVASIIAGLILISSLFYFSRAKAKKQAELALFELKETQKRLAIEKQYRDSELKALKSQMNPHFIFNALNSIQEYILLNQKNLASDYLGKFADLIRNYLHYSDTGFISIAEEIKNLNLYLELEKLRFEDNLTYTISTEDNLDNSELLIPTMLVQPYIENALKHGLLHKTENRKLSVSFSKENNGSLKCIVEDNGVGRDKAQKIKEQQQSNHKSFALNATQERLNLLNYGRSKKIGVDIIDLKTDQGVAQGTKVVLLIPVKK